LTKTKKAKSRTEVKTKLQSNVKPTRKVKPVSKAKPKDKWSPQSKDLRKSKTSAKRKPQKSVLEEKLETPIKVDGWLKLREQGVVLGNANQRSILLFRVCDDERVLPVWLNPAEALLAAWRANPDRTGSSHKLSREILEDVNVKISECRFSSLQAGSQFIDVLVHRRAKSYWMKARAEESMSFVCEFNPTFWVKESVLKMSQEVEVSMREFHSMPELNEERRRQGRWLF